MYNDQNIMGNDIYNGNLNWIVAKYFNFKLNF